MSMEKTKSYIRVFDAFPKTPPADQVGSVRGSYTTFLTYFFILFMLWVDIGGRLDGYIDHQFSVDDKIREKIDLNVDIIVAMPCKYLDANVRDVTEDRIMAEELLNFEGVRVPPYFWTMTPEKKEIRSFDIDSVLQNSLEADYIGQGRRVNVDLPACRISGTIPINRVQGDFHITAEGYGYLGSNIADESDLNLTHMINEFSFGTFYPYIDNSLDRTSQSTDHKRHTFHYNLKVIPSVFGRLGLEVETTQYSVQMYETDDKYVPGIFFKYDFEPIKMSMIEKRLSFMQFLIRVATIVGGLWVIASWLYRVSEKLIVLVMGEEYARRGEEKKGGLLDGDDEVFETI